MTGRALGRPAKQPSLNHVPDIGQSWTEHGLGNPARLQSLTSVLLATGGDARIARDPLTGRNRYGTLTTPAEDEISFSSTTATNISQEGLLAASAALDRFIGMCATEPVAHHAWFDDIRSRIGTAFGGTGAEVVLVASGTDAELIALSLIAARSHRPLANILTAPGETGSGVPLAAAGRHFSDGAAVGRHVAMGEMIDGIAPDRVKVCQVDIRGPQGEALDDDIVDQRLIDTVLHEVKDDRDVIIHVLDCSKTGLSGVTREAARHLVQRFPDRVSVIVDACQLRCPPAQLRQDLADGFIVAMTGSKYLAGPAFCGALLLPQGFTEIAANSALLAALADYTTAQDWPITLRGQLAFLLPHGFNLGLGLRWTAALTQAEGHSLPSDNMVADIRWHFVGLVRDRAAASRAFSIHPDDDGGHAEKSAIVSLSLTDNDGISPSFEELQKIHRLMRDGLAGPICHIGQAVRLGDRSILRIAASASDVNAVAAGMARGATIDQAFKDVEARLDLVFERLDTLHRKARDT